MTASLARLRDLSKTCAGVTPGDAERLSGALRTAAQTAAALLPGAAAVLYTCRPGQTGLDPYSRAAGGGWGPVPQEAFPRAQGLGAQALESRVARVEREKLHPAWRASGAQRVACLPLLAGGQPLGVLYVYLPEERDFSAEELALLQVTASLAAAAVYQSRRSIEVAGEVARKEDELNRLRRAGLLISSRSNLQETLDTILHMALEVTGARYGILRLADEQRRTLVMRALAGDALAHPRVEALPISGASVTAWVARNRQPALIPDLSRPPWSIFYYPLDEELPMRAELAVPLVGAGGRLEGVINLESPQVGAFDDDDRLLLQSLAAQAVIALQEARLLDALQEAAGLLLSHPAPEALQRILQSACTLLDAAAGMLWQVRGGELALSAALGPLPGNPRLPLEGSLTGEAVRLRRTVVSQDVRADPRFYDRALAEEQRWTHALIVPMLSGTGEALGALAVYSTANQSGNFVRSEWDHKVLACLAQYAALAVENEARQSELRAAQEQQAAAETFAALGDIAANLLHHLNNKVGSIPVRVEGIRDKCAAQIDSSAYLSANLAEIERSAGEAMESVRASLAHLQPSTPAPVSVAACVRDALVEARLPAAIQVEQTGLETLPAVTAGQRTLALVFVNLLTNAADAMPSGGRIRIRGALRGERVEVCVEDDGPGIPPELHNRIFEFNFSARPGARARRLGFGLWWVKTLTSRLGGTVSVESDGRRGTTFRLRLPLTAGGAP